MRRGLVLLLLVAGLISMRGSGADTRHVAMPQLITQGTAEIDDRREMIIITRGLEIKAELKTL